MIFRTILLLHIVFSSSCLLAQQEIVFENRALALGIDLTYNNQSFGGGVSFCDFDGDGWDDLTFASSNGQTLFILKNYAGGYFSTVGQIGISVAAPSKTILWLDYDNDGDKDLFVANVDHSNKLYRNDGNNFFDITALSGISTTAQKTIAACAGDYNNDGYLDLYITNRSGMMPNYLYRNNGNGTFTDVTPLAGVADASRLPLAAAFLDVNRDGWQDIYIANDRMAGNTLFMNNGDGTFADVSANSDAGLTMDAMGIAIGDYDNDFDLDMYISNTEVGNALMQNDGNGNFTNIAATAGVEVNKVCWGVNFLDYDNDTDLDLYVSVNHPSPEVTDISNGFFENSSGNFNWRSNVGFESDSSFSWGNAIGDLNNDGYYDIADINSLPDRASVWQNSGAENKWIKLMLTGTVSNRDAVGSIIEVHVAGQKFIRSIHCGLSYLSQNSSTEIIGLGSAGHADSVIVYWPSGDTDTYQNLAAGSTYLLEEGTNIVSGLEDADRLNSTFTLYGNYPNPFNPGTTISYELAKPANVDLTIYNALGMRVKTVRSGLQLSGQHKLFWNGRNDAGESVASGVYYYHLQAGKNVRSAKMILMK
ncbi:MAG: FG-GAP-like repeat-containing protein [Calditrichia bacterium]